MDNNMKAVFELSPAPMLAVEQSRIIHANSRAEEFFGKSIIGSPAVGAVPDHILTNASDHFVSTAVIKGRAFCVSAARTGGILYLSLAPERSSPSRPEFVSESLMCTILSDLCNIGFAIDRVNAETADCTGTKLEGYLSILNHSHYCLHRSLSNLSTAIALSRGVLPFSFRAVDLAKLCSDIVSTVTVLFAGQGISISFATTLGELYAYADSEKVERILLNIISNSLAHTPKGGRIDIKLERSAGSACISVDDNGSGIPSAKMAGLFTTYERELRGCDLSSMSTGGLGLGVARGLAEGHGGALLIESREGKGTSVRIMLPLQSAKLTTLESGGMEYENSGMHLILTELSSVLDSEIYTKKYTD